MEKERERKRGALYQSVPTKSRSHYCSELDNFQSRFLSFVLLRFQNSAKIFLQFSREKSGIWVSSEENRRRQQWRAGEWCCLLCCCCSPSWPWILCPRATLSGSTFLLQEPSASLRKSKATSLFWLITLSSLRITPIRPPFPSRLLFCTGSLNSRVFSFDGFLLSFWFCPAAWRKTAMKWFKRKFWLDSQIFTRRWLRFSSDY